MHAAPVSEADSVCANGADSHSAKTPLRDCCTNTVKDKHVQTKSVYLFGSWKIKGQGLSKICVAEVWRHGD